MSEKAKVFIGGGLTVGVSINGHSLILPLFYIYVYIHKFVLLTALVRETSYCSS